MIGNLLQTMYFVIRTVPSVALYTVDKPAFPGSPSNNKKYNIKKICLVNETRVTDNDI